MEGSICGLGDEFCQWPSAVGFRDLLPHYPSPPVMPPATPPCTVHQSCRLPLRRTPCTVHPRCFHRAYHARTCRRGTNCGSDVSGDLGELLTLILAFPSDGVECRKQCMKES